MCTAITYKTKDFYFGRNLDLEYRYREAVTVTPRNFPFVFRNGIISENHLAIIGIATVSRDYPLYYEAVNETGLGMAGLNFPHNATYYPKNGMKNNIAPFEFIPWILGKCRSVEDAVCEINKINLWDTDFSEEYPLSPLHWLLADKERAVTLEPMRDGLKIYKNPVGVLTNNPPFDFHMQNLAHFMNATAKPSENRFSDALELQACSVGMGAIGIPGDPSSASRFVKAAFVKFNSVCEDSESKSVNQFFHILSSVAQQRGVTCVKESLYQYTQYSSCCNATKGIYYYTTDGNSRITSVDMRKEDMDGMELYIYPLISEWDVYAQN